MNETIFPVLPDAGRGRKGLPTARLCVTILLQFKVLVMDKNGGMNNTKLDMRKTVAARLMITQK